MKRYILFSLMIAGVAQVRAFTPEVEALKGQLDQYSDNLKQLKEDVVGQIKDAPQDTTKGLIQAKKAVMQQIDPIKSTKKIVEDIDSPADSKDARKKINNKIENLHKKTDNFNEKIEKNIKTMRKTHDIKKHCENDALRAEIAGIEEAIRVLQVTRGTLQKAEKETTGIK